MPASSFKFDFDKTMYALQRVFIWLACFNIIWSIAVTSGLLNGLSIHFFNQSSYSFTVNFWLIQQYLLRGLIIISLIGLLVGTWLHRGDHTGYFGRTAVNL